MDIDVLIILITGALSLGTGVTGFVRGSRRMSLGLAVLVGSGLLVLGVAAAFARAGIQEPLLVIALLAVIGATLGYGSLAVYLVVNGVVVLRRESLTLGNSLALLTGLLMLVLPVVVVTLPTYLNDRTLPAGVAVVISAIGSLGMLVLAYVGVCFAVFLLSTVLYLRLPRRRTAGAVVVLGAGLIGGRVTPLLASRLDRAAAIQVPEDVPIITSGGQGADESRPEGEAMRDYLLERGLDPGRVIAETESRTTEENLLNSARIAGSGVPLVVVTSAYHTFRTAIVTRRLGLRARVVGARTARYYVPSALLREFVAVLREHWRTHVVLGALMVTPMIVLTWVSLRFS